MKKFKVTFLLSKKNIWIEKQLREFNFKIKNKYIFKITKNFRIIKGQDIVFAISYLKILPERFIKKNKLVLIPHPSKLPKNKGFAPVQYEILKNKNKLYISIIKAVKEVDSGPICFSGNFKLNGDELSREIREKQGLAILNSIKKVLIKYPNLIFKKQSGNRVPSPWEIRNVKGRSEAKTINGSGI